MSDKVRLIDANITKKAIELLCKNEKTNMTAITYLTLLELLDTMPTIEAEREKSWVSVKDRLPPVGENVLIVMSNSYIAIAALDKDKLGCSNDDEWFNIKNVTHWMPLPEPPKENIDYQIEVLLTPKYMNKKQWFFWCILQKDVIKEEVIKSNCGFGWSSSITTAFCDAYKYYSTFIALNPERAKSKGE